MGADLSKPRPFVKWAGGKTQLLTQLREAVPASWDPERDMYFEPFLGGGALYFDLGPRRAVLNDACADLMCAWNVVLGDSERLVARLSELEIFYASDPESFYYEVRSEVPGDEVGRAARLVFLNKTCFNGLFRVNRRGEFNVSWCKDGGVKVCDADNLRACSRYLRERRVELSCQSFDEHLQEIVASRRSDLRGALVYLDPPYVPSSRTAHFTRYTRDGFGYACQLHLASLASRLRDLGAHVVVSQAGSGSLIEEYESLKFKVRRVHAKRRISCNGEGRGDVAECIMTGSPRHTRETIFEDVACGPGVHGILCDGCGKLAVWTLRPKNNT